jgi:hypothetical protein
LVLAHSEPSFFVASHNVKPKLETGVLHFSANAKTLSYIIEFVARKPKQTFYQRH